MPKDAGGGGGNAPTPRPQLKPNTTLPDTKMAQLKASQNFANFGVAGGRPGYSAQNKLGISDDMTPEEINARRAQLGGGVAGIAGKVRPSLRPYTVPGSRPGAFTGSEPKNAGAGYQYQGPTVAPTPTPAQHPWQPFIDAAIKAHTGFNSLIQRMINEFQSQVRTGNAQPGGPGAMQPFQGMKQPGVDVIRGAEKKILRGK